MLSKSLRKGAAAIAVASALLLMFASPASAATLKMEVQGGTLTIGTTPNEVFNLAPGGGGTPPCTDVTDNLTLNTATPGAGQFTMSGVLKSYFTLSASSTTWYRADITVSGAGTYSGSSPYTLASTGPNHLIFQARVYSALPCDNTATICTITGRLAITAGSTYTGTLPAGAVGDDANVNASTTAPGGSALSAAACPAPFASFHGKSATLASLDLEVVP